MTQLLGANYGLTARTLRVDGCTSGCLVLNQHVMVNNLCTTGRTLAERRRTLGCHGWVRDKGERACDTLVESGGDALYLY
ncbi:hypothetical protein ACFQJ7_00035 [Halovenus rubra]|uniref:Uncharacterized protein n=2 Tax=Halovenus rubra TaxID=869890 RepID=A0ACC7E331_9EURY|nr:hypothetical protein [Halovenus rubra]